MTTILNRRAILAGAAALPATTLPVIAAPAAPDPIFAAIEAHREGWKALGRAVGETDRLVLALPRELRLTNTEWEYETDDPSWIAAQRAVDAAHESMDEEGLLKIIPTTLAGVRALAQYATGEEYDLESLPDGAQVLLATIATALSRIAAEA